MSLLNPGKLVQLGPTLYATHSSYYRQPCKDFTRSHLKKLGDVVCRIDDELELNGHRYILKALNKAFNGLTIPAISTAYLDPRRRTKNLIHTLCHEALHLKQVQDKRLIWDRNKKSIRWEGKLYEIAGKPDDDSWRELPWEKDVFKQENELFLKVTTYKTVPVNYNRGDPHVEVEK